MRPSFLSTLLIVLFLSGCDFKEIYERFIPEESEIAKQVLSRFAERNFEAIEAQLHPGIDNDDTKQKLREIAAFFPEGRPRGVSAVGANTFSSGDTWQGVFTFQYEYDRKWLLASVTLQRVNDSPLRIIGVNVQPIEGSLEELNRFQLDGKSLEHYAILLAAILVPIFIVAVLVVCIRTPIPRRKWLWIVFVLLGFAQISVNWTTGAVEVNPLSLQILGAGFTKASPYAPLILAVSVPLGAIIFLFKRRRWLDAAKGPAVARSQS